MLGIILGHEDAMARMTCQRKGEEIIEQDNGGWGCSHFRARGQGKGSLSEKGLLRAALKSSPALGHQEAEGPEVGHCVRTELCDPGTCRWLGGWSRENWGGGEKTEGLPAPHVSEADETGKTSPFLSPSMSRKQSRCRRGQSWCGGGSSRI